MLLLLCEGTDALRTDSKRSKQTQRADHKLVFIPLFLSPANTTELDPPRSPLDASSINSERSQRQSTFGESRRH